MRIDTILPNTIRMDKDNILSFEDDETQSAQDFIHMFRAVSKFAGEAAVYETTDEDHYAITMVEWKCEYLGEKVTYSCELQRDYGSMVLWASIGNSRRADCRYTESEFAKITVESLKRDIQECLAARTQAKETQKDWWAKKQ